MKLNNLAILAALLLSENYASAACKFDLDAGKTELKWTGYKTPKKLAVSGKFTKFDLKGQVKGDDVMSAIKDLNFSMDLSSLNSGDEGRDIKISKILFMGTDKIVGKVKSTTKEHIIFETTINGVTKEIPLKYTIKDNEINAQGFVDVLDFALSKNLLAFGTACGEKHEGKSWSDAMIDLKLSFAKTCK